MNNNPGYFKPRTRTYKFLPQWIKRRIEVNVYELYNYIAQAGMDTPPSSLVLDAGAGEGRFKPEFAHTKYFGVDLAVGDVAWDYSGLDAICNLFNLPFNANSFDVALCLQTLEHVAEPFVVISELARVLKPNGVLYLSAPQSWHQHQKPHDYYRYTSFGLRYLFEKAGLVVEDIKPMGGYFWFLSFQLQNINFWLFPKGSKYRWLTLPFRAFNGLVFQLLLPLILFYLDPLDKIKDETFGYICKARKPLS